MMHVNLLIVVTVISASTKVCSAFGNVLDDRVGTTPLPVVGAPADVQCPILGQLLQGTYLQTDEWSLMRTVNIMTKNQLFSDEIGAPTAGVSEMQEVSTNPGAPQANAQTQSVADLAEKTDTDTKIGTITSPFLSWTTEYHLTDPHGKLVSKIVNPGFFWDTFQEIRNCEGEKIGSIRYKYEFKKMFENKYTAHEVLDAQGQHIADLAEAEEESNSIFGTRQYFIYLKDRAGNAVAAMRNPRNGWELGPFNQAFDVDIDLVSQNMMVPPPANNPEFLLLVFANALAMDARFGPYWSIGITCLVILGVVMLACCCICNTKAAKVQMDSVRARAEEERMTLLGSRSEPESKPSGLLNCCSRR
jgi:hypothetical protein